MKSSMGLPRHDDCGHIVDVLLPARRPRRLLVSCEHHSGANKSPSAVTAYRFLQRKPNRELRTVCAAKKKKQQFGPGVGVAVPGMLDEEVEAAYKQFGRALGETPRETSKVVRAKYNIPAAPPQPAARRPVSSGGPSERQFTEESYAQFEAMLNSAMKGSGDSQPRALVKGKNTVALQAGERERRKVMMELMESTLSPEAAPFSLDLGLDRIRPAAQRPEEEVPQLILPRGKVAAPAKRPAGASAEGTPPTRAGPLPVPALQMPRGKLPKRERPTAAAAAPVAPPRPLPTPAVAPKPSLGPPKVDWKVTEIDEDYLESTKNIVVRRPAPAVPEKQSPPEPEEPLPAIVRPPKPRTEPEVVPESVAPKQATSAEEPAAVKDSAASKPVETPRSNNAQRPQGAPFAAAPRQRGIDPQFTIEVAAQKAQQTSASTAAKSGAPPRQSTAKKAAAEKPAPPVRPPVTPVPTLLRPTTAPASAEPPRAAAAADALISTPGADAASAESPASSAARNDAGLRVTPDAAEAASGGAAADVAARSAGGEEDASSSAAAAGAGADAAAEADVLPAQAADVQLTDDRPIKAQEGRAEAVSGAAPVAPLQQPLPPASKPVRPQPVSAAAGRDDVYHAYDAAMAAFMAQQPLFGTVTQVMGTSGVIVRVQGKFRGTQFRGFLPWSKLLARRQAGLLERERAAWAAMDLPEDKSDEQAARAQLRRTIMGAIVDQRVVVYVHKVEPPLEGTNKLAKVLLSERGPVYKPDLGVPPYAIEVLEQKLGERVECTVAKLMRYGVFLNLAVEVAPGCMCEVYGLMHHSKMGGLAAEPLQEGQDVTAYIEEVDAVNGRVQLSAEPPKAGLPLNQTLEDLLRRGTSEGPQSDEGEEAMPEAMDVCKELLVAGAITEALPSRRLQGRAFSPEVQVFMAKRDEETDTSSAEGEVKRYTLLARARNEVQEIDVESALDREQMKAALAQALSIVLGVQ